MVEFDEFGPEKILEVYDAKTGLIRVDNIGDTNTGAYYTQIGGELYPIIGRHQKPHKLQERGVEMGYEVAYATLPELERMVAKQ